MLRAATAATSLSITCGRGCRWPHGAGHRPFAVRCKCVRCRWDRWWHHANGTALGNLALPHLLARKPYRALPAAEMAVNMLCPFDPISMSANRPPQPMLAPPATVFARWTAGRCVKTIWPVCCGLVQILVPGQRFNQWPHIAHHRNATRMKQALQFRQGGCSPHSCHPTARCPHSCLPRARPVSLAWPIEPPHIGSKTRGRFAEPCCRHRCHQQKTRTPVPCNHLPTGLRRPAGRQVQRQRRHHAGTRHGSQLFQPQATRSWPQSRHGFELTVELILNDERGRCHRQQNGRTQARHTRVANLGFCGVGRQTEVDAANGSYLLRRR